MHHKDIQIGIIGIGNVGLPLAVEFGKILPTVGLDINWASPEEVKNGHFNINFVKNKILKFVLWEHLSYILTVRKS